MKMYKNNNSESFEHGALQYELYLLFKSVVENYKNKLYVF